MTRTRLLTASLAAVLGLTACEGLKEAMTAHVDTVARAGSQELTVTRLAELVGPTDVPLQADAIRTIAQLWVNYQLLGHAAARGDSLFTDADADLGMWSAIAQMRSRKLYDELAKGWSGNLDPATFEKAYNDGVLLAASHILLSKQPEGMSPEANAATRAEAEKIATQLKNATLEQFGAVARARTQDPGSKDRGGDYGVFARGQMVAEFDAGILSVAPGAVTGVVETQFGYHIIRRHTYAEIADQFPQQYMQIAGASAESTYFAGVEKAANVQVRASAAKLVKAIAEDVDAYRDDKTVIATARTGDLTAARMSMWMAAFPAQTRMRQQVVQAPDSLIPMFVKDYVMRNELLLRAADSAGVTLDSADVKQIREAFRARVTETMTQLGLTPKLLADSAADTGARERLAASRVDEYLGKLVKNEVQYVDVAEQIALVLRGRYESRLVPAGVDRVLAEATKLRAVADSVRAATQPPTAVPMGPPAGAPVAPPMPQP
ncbi:MAG: peptidylprolyl isomerase [Gemmatimonadaceae bacterium]|nr:peptidylprolyl isomerase [Gemmatimonadaceae bacterium]